MLLLWTTVRAYLAARQRAIAAHRRWMLLSYALIFAAVTLRIELPLLISACASPDGTVRPPCGS